MKKMAIMLGAIIGATVNAYGIWVPADTLGKPNPATGQYYDWLLSAPGQHENSTGSSYAWIELPDLNIAVSPVLANKSVVKLQPDNAPDATQQNVEQTEKTVKEVKLAHINDISCDVENGFVKYLPPSNSTPFRGIDLLVKGRFERLPDDYSSIGAIGYYNLTSYYAFPSGFSDAPKPTNMASLSGFYKRYITSEYEAAGMVNVSLLFASENTRNDSITGEKIFELKTYFTINPQIYYVYKHSFDNVRLLKGVIDNLQVFGGAFAGYAYTNFSMQKNLFPYAALGGAGVTIGERIAFNADLALSHQFLIIGAQIPVFVSSKFSLTPGIKLPILFGNRGFTNFRITLGASARL